MWWKTNKGKTQDEIDLQILDILKSKGILIIDQYTHSDNGKIHVEINVKKLFEDDDFKLYVNKEYIQQLYDKIMNIEEDKQ